MTVKTKHSRHFITRALAVFGAAVSAAAAVDVHSRPASKDLRKLGINPSDFNQIK